MLEINTFLVRHGRYDSSTEELTQQGIRDAELAAEELMIDHKLGSSALILSSDAPRALGTARVIAEQLAAGPVLSSTRVNEGGNSPILVEDLDRWLLTAVEESDGDMTGKDGLVVVAHQPLIEAALRGMGMRLPNVGYGSVWGYEAGSWKNPHFRPERAEKAEARIQEHLQGS